MDSNRDRANPTYYRPRQNFIKSFAIVIGPE